MAHDAAAPSTGAPDDIERPGDQQHDAAGTGAGHAAAAPDAAAADGSTAAPPAPAGSPTSDRTFRVALALGLAPLAVAAVVLVIGVGGDHMPAGDLAMTEMHTRDVGRHPVLIGLHSRPDWNHPGPLQFYLSAPIYRLTGGASISMLLAALAINAAAVAGTLAVARRRGGTPVLLCTLVALLLLMRTMGPEALSDNWNLTLTTLPYLLLAYLTWSMICGERWALPVGALVTSFLVQTHVGFLATAAPLFAVGVAALGVRAWRDGARDGWRTPAQRALVRAVALTAGVTALVWLPPVIDVVVNSPANATKIFEYFQEPPEPTRTLGEGWRVTSGQFGIAGEWLTGKMAPNPFTGESRYLTSTPVPVLLVPVAVASVVLWRRRPHGRGLVVAVWLMVVLTVVSVARTVGSIADYRLRYTWVPPAVAAGAVLWAAWAAWTRRRPGDERRLAAVALAAAAALSVVTSVSAVRAGEPHAEDSRVVEQVSSRVIDAYDDAERPVVVDELTGIAGVWFSRALVLQLERHGVDVRVHPHLAMFYSPERVHEGGPVADHLLVVTGDDVERVLDLPGLRLLARWQWAGDAHAEAAAEELRDALEEGELRGQELADAYAELAGDGAEAPGTHTGDVAVFADERPNAGRPGAQHELRTWHADDAG